ncbi:hypothetical protein GGG16DRAFT_55065 [Schizophyllum commune]
MPPTVAKELDKTCRAVFWEHKKPLIAAETIRDDLEQGGAKLLDIEARNEAIDVQWIKRYLTMDEKPTWTYVLDALCQMHLLSRDKGKCHPDSFVSTMLQIVDVNERNMPRVSKRTMKAITKHNARFDPVNPTTAIKEQMPIWHHLFIPLAKRPTYNTTRCKCMRENHEVKTVSDAITLTRNILGDVDHTTRPTCKCTGCASERSKGCDNPNGCAHAAKALLDKLPAKWDPRKAFKVCHELDDFEHERNEEAREKRGPLIFDPSIPREGDMRDCYRIFGVRNNQDPAEAKGETDKEAPYREIFIWEETCRTTEINPTCEKDEIQIGVGIWAGDDIPVRESIREGRSTKGCGIITGAMAVLHEVDDQANVALVLNNRQIVRALTDKLKALEDSAWLDFPNRNLMMTLVAKLRTRCGRTSIRTSAKGDEGAKRAQERARAAARRTAIDRSPMWLEPNEVRGARLRTMTQRQAYREIKTAKRPPARKQAQPQLARIRLAMQRTAKRMPDDKEIWKSIQRKENRKKVKQFKYRVIHNTLRCGDFWKHIPDCEERAYCGACSTPTSKVTETPKHILTECTAPGQATIWTVAKEICRKRKIPWKGSRLGRILASDMVDLKDSEGKTRAGDNRLYRIVMAEGMYLAWLIRNERVIQNEGDAAKYPPPAAIRQRFLTTLRKRKDIDYTLTNKAKFKRRALSKDLVEDTWREILEEEPPPDEQAQQARGFSG